MNTTSEDSGLVGIVTVLFNSDDVLPGFFKSLACQRGVRYRLYVIDNSKIDSGSRLSRELADFHGIDTEIVFNNENVGVARGNNQGIDLALRDGCTQVLLSNNDIEFTDPNLIADMVSFKLAQHLDAVVPKIYYFSEPTRIWCAGGRFSLHTATTPHFGDGEIDLGQYDIPRSIEYAPTCFMLLSADVFRDVGKMDERYFVYYDDTDFLWRMKVKRRSLYFWPKGQVWHKVSFSTGGGESEFSLYYGSRNRIYFVKKHYKASMRAVAISYFLITRLITALRMNKSKIKAMKNGIISGFNMKS